MISYSIQAKNVRFQMIQLRRNKVQEFKNYRMIPITEKEIPRGILEAREKRLEFYGIRNSKMFPGKGAENII